MVVEPPPLACVSVSDPTPVSGQARPVRLWEHVLGVVGRVLVATGLLLLAFVGYQLWGTGIEQAQRQNSLTSEFEALLAATTTTTTTAPATTTTPTSTPDTTVAPPEPAPEPEPGPESAEPMAIPATGEPVARMEIPELDVDQIVVMGVTSRELKMGPGHFPGTPLPGQLGNAAIAGHRTSYGAPFGDLDRLEEGDELVLTTLAGQFRYRVTGAEVVDPSAVYVVDTVDADRATLTLVTCHPRYSVKQRLIVRAELDESGSPEPVRPTPSTTVPIDPDSMTPAATLPDMTPEDPDTIVVDPVEEVDPFAEGWFADDAAWWHVAGWGTLLSAIAIAATWFGRRLGNQRLGAVAGLLPFFVVLYFFFQNVNRLLPPGL